MNPYDHLESEQKRRYENRHFLIENIKYLCDFGSFHSIEARKGKYVPVNVNNKMREIFIKEWKDRRLLVLY